MLRLSASQIKALDEAAARRFQQRMVQHIRRYFPEQCSILSADEIVMQVERNIASAKAYGITEKRDVCRYLNIVMAMGGSAAAMEEQAWATRILHNPSLSARARLLLLDRAVADILCQDDGTDGGEADGS